MLKNFKERIEAGLATISLAGSGVEIWLVFSSLILIMLLLVTQCLYPEFNQPSDISATLLVFNEADSGAINTTEVCKDTINRVDDLNEADEFNMIESAMAEFYKPEEPGWIEFAIIVITAVIAVMVVNKFVK